MRPSIWVGPIRECNNILIFWAFINFDKVSILKMIPLRSNLIHLRSILKNAQVVTHTNYEAVLGRPIVQNKIL